MYVTKRDLGESYIAGTGVVLGLVVLGQLLVSGMGSIPWGLLGLLPVFVLVASVRWVNHLDFEGDEVWTVAVYSATALGVAAVVVALLDSVVRPFAFSTADTLLLVTSLGTVTVTGALVGVLRELRRSNRRLALRNAVLHRVLRHNLRNDMTVVLCLLDDLEAESDQAQQETVAKIRGKIEGLVDTTDKVRQANVTVSETGPPSDPVDLAVLVARRVDRLTAEYPGASLDADLPDRALARTNGEFGLVLDNVVQSAARRGDEPELSIVLGTAGETVHLCIEDHSGAIPDADLSAVASASETALQHGFGTELWLVYWLVDASGGDIQVETQDGVRRLDIRLDRATAGLFPRLP